MAKIKIRKVKNIKERALRRDERVKEKEEKNNRRCQEDIEDNRKILHYNAFEIAIKNDLDMNYIIFTLKIFIYMNLIIIKIYSLSLEKKNSPMKLFNFDVFINGSSLIRLYSLISNHI